MENKSIYILNLVRFDEGSGKVTESIVASQDNLMLYDRLALKAKELAEQVGVLEKNKNKNIISSASFQVLEGRQKMYYWKISVESETILELSISELEMI